MSFKIKNFKIQNLFGTKDLEWNLGDVSVLVGKNGSGKSTILDTIKNLLLQEADRSLHQCGNVEITLSDGTKIKHNQIPLKSSEINEFLKAIKTIVSEQNQKNKIKDTAKTKLEDELKKFDEIISGINTTENNKSIRTGFFQVETEVTVDSDSDGNRKLNIPFEYISTINMNANSLNEVKSSDGNKTTILDMEIKKEISRLNSFSTTNPELYSSVKTRFESAINDLFSEGFKEINISDDLFFVSTINKNKIRVRDLSSGERQLVYTLLKASVAAFTDSILLMDEPEISLHLSWQEKLISKIKYINPNGQIIIVTHSPAVVMNGWMTSYVDIKDLEKRS